MDKSDITRYSYPSNVGSKKIECISYNIPALPPGYAKCLKERKFTIKNPSDKI